MLSSKNKSGFPDVVNNKNAAAKKIGRLGSTKLEADSPSPQKNPSFSNDISPRSADSKQLANRRSPKTSGATPDKQLRALKVPELQLQLTAAQEDLIRAKERLAFEEKEKTRLFEELNDAKKAVEVTNAELSEALLARKKAEESSELDKFRADELEQLSIEDAQRKEEKWKIKLEDIQKQHDIDALALLSATAELQKVKHELAMAADATNTALIHADDAMKVAEINAEKVEILSGELNHLQSLLDSKLENNANETEKQTKKLSSDVEGLKHELEKAKLVEEKLVEMEALVEGLKVELIDTRRAESDAMIIVDDWKRKAELLESYMEEMKESERLVHNSLDSSTKQLDEAKTMLGNAESEVISLKGKVEALELEVASHKTDHEKFDSQLGLANQEVLLLETTIEVLKSELIRVEDEKAQALNNEKITTFNLETLTQEKSNLDIELEITREDSEKAKKAMEGLVSALHEVSTEARYIKERLLIKQAEIDNVTADEEKLQLTLQNTRENYEVMLSEANKEILSLKKVIDTFKTEAKDLKAQWNEKEINLQNTMTKTDDELLSITRERDDAVETLERKENEVKAAEEEVNKLHDNLKQAESELCAANDAMGEAMAESRRLKERLLDKENELQNITQENDELRVRNTNASEKIEELSELLFKLSSKKEGNGHRRGSTEYGENRKLFNDDKLPKLMELMKDKVYETETGNSETALEEAHQVIKEAMELEENGTDEGNRARMKPNVCDGESFDKLISEREHSSESMDEGLSTQIDRNNLEHVNIGSERHGNISPTKRHELQKKKKDLLHKFGSILKKKNASK